MQLSIWVPIGPHRNLNPDFKHWRNLYPESYLLPVIHYLLGYGLSGNKLGGSNLDPLYRKLTGYKKSVRHASTRAYLYFSPGRWSARMQRRKPSILVVMGTSSKDDPQVVAYSFLNFSGFLRHLNLIQVSQNQSGLMGDAYRTFTVAGLWIDDKLDQFLYKHLFWL